MDDTAVAVARDDARGPADRAAPGRTGQYQRGHIVIEARKGQAGGRELDLLVHKAEIDVVPVDAEQVAEARRAYRRFGRGHHAAGLNLGDVFAYALARTSNEPLLFKGDDFSKTDVGRVL